MRHPFFASFVLAAGLAAFNPAGTAAQDASQPTPQQAAPAPEQGTNPSAAPQGPGENRKDSGTNDQAGPSNASPAADPNSQADRSTHSVSGRAGKEEPSSHAPTAGTQAAAAPAQPEGPVLVNGALNVNGAPADSQTVPAKFSARNDRIDKLPIMAMPLGLTDAQKRLVLDSVKQDNRPVQQSKAKPAEELPLDVTIHDLPAASRDPALAQFKYVRTPDRVLLIYAPNRVVVGEIGN